MASSHSCIFGPSGETRTRGILGFAAGLRCPKKSSYLVKILDFFDRCTQTHFALSAPGSARAFGPKQETCFVRRMPQRFLPYKRKARTPYKRIPGFWSKWRDSNSRHPAPKAGALPTALHLDRYSINIGSQSRRASCCGTRHLCRRQAPSVSADRSHSLSSLNPPQAALASLPNCATPG